MSFYMNLDEYRKSLNDLTSDELSKLYSDEFGIELGDDIDDDDMIDELVDTYARVMKSRGEL